MRRTCVLLGQKNEEHKRKRAGEAAESKLDPRARNFRSPLRPGLLVAWGLKGSVRVGNPQPPIITHFSVNTYPPVFLDQQCPKGPGNAPAFLPEGAEIGFLCCPVWQGKLLKTQIIIFADR